MSIPLPTGKAFDINSVNEQYARLAGENGLTKSLHKYQQAKNPHSSDYDFGKLTELYFDLQGQHLAHWRRSVATFAEIHPLLKSVIITALTNQPPLEIQWNWDRDARPAGPNVSKGVSIVYDSSANPYPKYSILIFGYTMPS